MEERNGIISEEQLKNYEGADIILMQNSNEMTDSGIGGELSGTGNYRWYISWNENGFVGVNWIAFSGTNLLEQLGTIDAIVSEIEGDPVTYAVSVATTNFSAHKAGCAYANHISS